MIRSAAPPVRFEQGQLVSHVRYGYRGVVVAYDLFCIAPDNWYKSNQTQPEKNQPWYHVLVDGGGQVTYAAQTSLEEDEEGGPVDNPLVDTFFSEFTGQKYIRNDQKWPGTWD
jgi:heat shock protein HspQ